MSTQQHKGKSDTALACEVRRGFLRVSNSLFRCEFVQEQGGFPSRLSFAGEEQDLFSSQPPRLSVVLEENQGQVYPVWDGSPPDIQRDGSQLRVGFHDLRWRGDPGAMFADGRLSLQYEFHEDGVVFVTTFFHTDSTTPPLLGDFSLRVGLSLAPEQEANWSYWRLPSEVSGKLIQDLSHFERNLPPGDTRLFDKTILPFLSFDFGTGGCRDRHLEFFVESWNSLTPDHKNTATCVEWTGRDAAIQWTFQKEPATLPTRGLQWRNVWGWCLRRFPVKRRRAPWRIFHYLDSFERYPTASVIRQMADEGGNLLILHEGWRKDMQNGEFPYDLGQLRKTMQSCRKHGLRLVLYVRGNEDVVRERACRDLRPFLQRNRDGVYMDYGGPLCFMKVEENSPGGRIPFQEYYASHQTVRDFVGEDGIFISHTGSFFSAVGHTVVDAYLGGEQEKGALLKNSTIHAYFSGLSVAPTSLWTAAFPTYRTRQAIPFLAATHQAPFLHLGNQIPCSSLVHPQAPSVITFARPLWRLWELFDDKRDIAVHCAQNAPEAFKTDSPATGASVMIDGAGDILLIASNFSEAKRTVSLEVDWRALGTPPGTECLALECGYEGNTFGRQKLGRQFQGEIDGHGLRGWLIVKKSAVWRDALARFIRPYPPETTAAKAHWRRVEEIRRCRFQPPAWESHFLRVSIPNWVCTWESSIWYDLYENTIELQDWTDPQNRRRLGYLSRQGLVKRKPSRDDLIWPGVQTPWIPLAGITQKRAASRGTCLALVTRKGANEFYSFVKGELSPEPNIVKESYEINFCNEIDLDWSVLNFKIER